MIAGLDSLGKGFQKHYESAHRHLHKQEPNRQVLYAKIALVLGVALMLLGLFHKVTLLCLTIILGCLVLLLKIKV